MPTWTRPVPPLSAYTTIDDLIVQEPVVIPAGTTATEAAALMTRLDTPFAAVRRSGGGFAMTTDALIRRAWRTPAGYPPGRRRPSPTPNRRQWCSATRRPRPWSC